MKFCSIVVVHYSQPDDSGEKWQKWTDDPKYSRSALLRQCLDSIKKNTDYPAELIVIDNGGKNDDSDYLLGKVREGVINTYIRNKNNLNFGWAWNIGKKVASGDYLCLTCNDLYFSPGWLRTCIDLFEKYDNGKIFVAPYLTKCKFNKWETKILANGTRTTPAGGSNCLIGVKSMFDDIGDYTTSNIAGSIWQCRLKEKGYNVYFPKDNYAVDIGTLGGQNFNAKTKIVKVLLNGEVVDYTYKNENTHPAS